ncbi:hypothetical protein [Mesomycoplasma lagogenitalium]|uniref:Uncharacterized protein n=1 Tax=Mesomycoplasma lagogenitalium TaxID=171286 RepID=A0ABY8LUI4_9BACT|nr:hypothetical protein [Mesomycoplasma lagogenitalium]WGI36360.1 hypothetical protein QEG99_02675 [Mesomycoplasma lagogenitalium]
MNLLDRILRQNDKTGLPSREEILNMNSDQLDNWYKKMVSLYCF